MIRCVSGSEPERRMSSTNAQLATSSSYATFSTPKPTQCTTVPSTAELYRTLRLMPDGRYDCRDFSKDLVVLVLVFLFWVIQLDPEMIWSWQDSVRPSDEFLEPLYCQVFLFNFSSSRHTNRGCWQDSCVSEGGDARFSSKNRLRCEDLSIFSLDEDENRLAWSLSVCMYVCVCGCVWFHRGWADTHDWIQSLLMSTKHLHAENCTFRSAKSDQSRKHFMVSENVYMN